MHKAAGMLLCACRAPGGESWHLAGFIVAVPIVEGHSSLDVPVGVLPKVCGCQVQATKVADVVHGLPCRPKFGRGEAAAEVVQHQLGSPARQHA